MVNVAPRFILATRSALNTSVSHPVLNPIAHLVRQVESPETEPALDIATVFNHYHRRVFAWCFRIVRNIEDAQDLTQEAFIQIMRKLHTFNGGSAPSTWLYRVVVNTVLMWLRKKHLPQISLDEIIVLGEQALVNGNRSGHAGANQEGSISRIDLEWAISQLPARYSAILGLHGVEGYEHQEIAGMLGMFVGTSKSQLHRARKRLRILLESGRELTHGALQTRGVRQDRNSAWGHNRNVQRSEEVNGNFVPPAPPRNGTHKFNS